MSDTPETDHLESGLGTAAEMIHPTFWKFNRTLERERDDAIAESTNAVNDIIRVAWERDDAREQRDRLAEALRGMLDLWDKIGGSDTDYYVEKAEEALQSLATNEP